MRRYRNEIVVCLGLAVLTLGALGHVCGNGFVNYDDGEYVVRNREVKAGLTPEGLAWAFTTTRAANWHPLTWLSLQLDAQVYGAETAWGYHLTNLLLHAANAVLLFLALRLMTGAVWRSAAVAALFAVHPLHVESVAWVAERKDVLSGLFWMLTLLAYAWYVRRPGWGRYLLVLAAFALGLMAKPMLVTLPCVLLLLDYWPLQRGGEGEKGREGDGRQRRFLPLWLVLEKLPLFALTAAACLVTVYAQKKGGAVNTLEQLPLGDRAMNSVAAYAGYLGKMVWPARLAPFYPHPRETLLLGQAGRAALVLAAVSALVLWGRRRRYLAVGWLWYLGTLVPVIGLVQVGAQALADRYTYLPYVGLFVALVWGAADLAGPRRVAVSAVIPLAALLLGLWGLLGLWLLRGVGAEMLADRRVFVPVAVLTVLAVIAWWAGTRAGLWPRRLPPLAAALALLLGACVALTVWQARLWQNSIWLWEYTVQVTQDNWIAHNNLGDAYWNSRHPERVRRATENFQATLRLVPAHAKAHNNLGLILMDQGQVDAAIEHFKAAREHDRTLAVVPLNWGIALARQGKYPEAVARYEEALGVDPDLASAHDQLGQARAAAGQWDQARDDFDRALALEPKEKAFRANRAWALWHLGRKDEAAKEYQAVVAGDEEWPERVRAVAWAQATDPDERRRYAFAAVRRAEQACQARGACDPRFLDTLAAAYAEAGRFDDAVAAARDAHRLAAGDAGLERAIKARLSEYEAGRPFRDGPRPENGGAPG